MIRKTAKEILAESFRELAENKPIDKITVKDITDNCGYSPATFYRQFKDKYDLIAWDHTRDVEKIMNRLESNEISWDETLLEIALMFERKKDYLSNLFLNTSGHDSFILYVIEINGGALRRYMMKENGIEELDLKTEMYIREYCYGTVNLSCEWVLGKFSASPQELAEVFKNSLPSILRPYLYKDETKDL